MLSENRLFDDLAYALWLSAVPKLGPVRFKTLLTLYNNDLSVIPKLNREQLLCIRGIDEKIADAILASSAKLDSYARAAEHYRKVADNTGSAILRLADASYPLILKQTTIAPPILFVKGCLAKFNAIAGAVAIVGTREASEFGLEAARRIAESFAGHGWAVVSGLAKGVDLAAHEGALRAAGFTVGVLGCGVDVVYPPESQQLRRRMEQEGAVISEYPFQTRPSELNLKKRNKVTVGMAQAVIVVETKEKGGTFNAVLAAGEQKKPLFALVPGSRDGFEGNHKLLESQKALPIEVEGAFETVLEHVSPWVGASC